MPARSSEAAVRSDDGEKPKLVPDLARALLRRLTEPTPNAQAKLYAPRRHAGRRQPGARRARAARVITEPLPPAVDARPRARRRSAASTTAILAWLPHSEAGPGAGFRPVGRRPGLAARRARGNPADRAPTRAARCRPISAARRTTGCWSPSPSRWRATGTPSAIVLLTREAREVDDSLLAVRRFDPGAVHAGARADGAAVLVSVADDRAADPAAGRARPSGCARAAAGPARCRRRCSRARDEIGELAGALDESARALWDRMDAIERFAADVAHEIKNPLSLDPQRHRDAARASRTRPSSGACSRSSPRMSAGSTG